LLGDSPRACIPVNTVDDRYMCFDCLLSLDVRTYAYNRDAGHIPVHLQSTYTRVRRTLYSGKSVFLPHMVSTCNNLHTCSSLPLLRGYLCHQLRNYFVNSFNLILFQLKAVFHMDKLDKTVGVFQPNNQTLYLVKEKLAPNTCSS